MFAARQGAELDPARVTRKSHPKHTAFQQPNALDVPLLHRYVAQPNSSVDDYDTARTARMITPSESPIRTSHRTDRNDTDPR
jgi:hypothetical protein